TLGDGVHTILASETDLAGNTGSASLSFTLDTTAPTVSESLASDSGDSSSDQYTKNDTLTGSAEAGRVVTLTEGATTLGSATANAGGVWSFTPTLGDGVHTIIASETDLAGNTGSASLSFTLDTTAPTVSESLASDSGDSSSDQYTKNDTLTGSAEAGRVVTLTEVATTLGCTTAKAGCRWRFTASLDHAVHPI